MEELTEKQIEVNCNSLQEESINAPVYMLQRLSTPNLILSFIGESISGYSEQVDTSIFRAHSDEVTH